MVENATLSQQNLRDPQTHRKMFREYYKDSQLEKETWDKVDSMIDLYVDKLTGQDETLRNIQWEINKLEFDNLFSYGEGNSITFDSALQQSLLGHHFSLHLLHLLQFLTHQYLDRSLFRPK